MRVTLMQLIFLVKFLLKQIKRLVVRILPFGNLLYLKLLCWSAGNFSLQCEIILSSFEKCWSSVLFFFDRSVFVC